MSWFDRFRNWGLPEIETFKEEKSNLRPQPQPAPQPPKPAYLSPLVEPYIRSGSFRAVEEAIRYDIYGLLRKEHETLERLGLPIPKMEFDVSFTTKGYKDRVYVSLGSYSIPKNESFLLRFSNDGIPPEIIQTDGVFKAKKENFDFLRQGPTYVVKDEASAAAARTLFRRRPIWDVVKEFPGVWVNRHPYALYQLLQKLRFEMKDYVVNGSSNYSGHKVFYTNAINFTAILLKEVKAETPETLDLSRCKYALYTALTEGVYGYESLDPHKVDENTISRNSTERSEKLTPPTNRFPEQLTTLKILPDKEVSFKQSKGFLESLHHSLRQPVAFELVSQAGTIYFQLICASREVATVKQQLRIHFPDFAVLPHATPETDLHKGLYVMKACPRYFHECIKTGAEFSLDTYAQLFATLAEESNQLECMQILFVRSPNELVNTVTKAFWDKAEHNVRKKQLENKLPAWLMGIRFFSSTQERPKQLATNFLQQHTTVNQTWMMSSVEAVSRLHDTLEPWSLVDTSELATLAHFPQTGLKCDRLETLTMKARLPPENFTTGEVLLGISEARGQTKPVAMPNSVRDRHLYIVGKSGMGKSTLITNAVIANMQAGEGVCVIDPHGDLVASGEQPLLDYVPEYRIRDTIYFNAADKEYPLALNMLSARHDDELSLLADNLLVMFRRQSDGWGPRMEDILRATLQTLMHTSGSSFLDIKRLLHNEAFRQSVVRRLTHPMLKEFWEEDYPTNYNRKDIAAPIISRVNKFLYLPQLYTMLSSPESKLDFYDIIQSKKILLVNLSSGTIGEDNAQLLGSLIVTQLQMAAMRRADSPPSQRHPFYLYVDEFQNFTTASFEKILSEARKYKLCLTLAHQYISQISETQRDAIFGNVGSMIMFSCGDRDAHALRYQLGSYEPQDLVNLKKYEALCRPESARDTFPFKTIPPPGKPGGFAEAIIEHTRMTYATIIDPDVQPEAQEQPIAEASPARPQAKPAKALAKNFSTKGDEILFYVEQAEYLNTAQIKQLCYGHLVETARAPAASRDLKKLIDAKRLKSEVAAGGNIYFSGRSPKPTSHNLEVRNLLVKIIRTGFEIAEVTFCPQLPSLVPDLAVSFLTEDGGILKTFWEYDAGTEGIAELMKKVARYVFFKDEAAITFVFNSRSRLEQVNRSIKDNFIRYAVLEEIGTLHDPIFQQASGGTATPFF